MRGDDVRQSGEAGGNAPQPSERLRKALGVGDTLDLFPLFREWPTEELQALLKDVEQFTGQQYKAIDEAWKTVAFKPEVFLNAPASKKVDKMKDEKKFMTMSVMSEICSVAIFYLHERGIRTEAE